MHDMFYKYDNIIMPNHKNKPHNNGVKADNQAEVLRNIAGKQIGVQIQDNARTKIFFWLNVEDIDVDDLLAYADFYLELFDHKNTLVARFNTSDLEFDIANDMVIAEIPTGSNVVLNSDEAKGPLFYSTLPIGLYRMSLHVILYDTDILGNDVTTDVKLFDTTDGILAVH